MTTFDLDLSKYNLGWSDEVEYAFKPEKGLNHGVIDQIAWWKGEPRWMQQARQRSLRLFERKPMADVVRGQHARPRLPGHLLLPQAVDRSGRRAGTTCPSR